jgi:hypothetical protein
LAKIHWNSFGSRQSLAATAAEGSFGVLANRQVHYGHRIDSRSGCGVLSLSDISGWRDGVLYPLAGGRRRLWRGAFRPARAAWVVQRLLAARR